MQRRPDFFIVGAPKCGTTAMADYLAQHPDIFLPEAKDSHFFGSDLQFFNNISHPSDLFRVSEETYLSWFAKAVHEKRIGEASVLYLYSKKAPREIKNFSPDARIIIMLRNPVSMMYSLHGHFLTDLNEDIICFEEALVAEKDRKKLLRIPTTSFSIDGLFYREVASYSEQVERYFDTFGRERVHVIIFEDFKNDTLNIYRQTLSFLDVKTDHHPNFQIVNPAKKIRNRKLQQFFVHPPGVFLPLGRALSNVKWLRETVKTILFFMNVDKKKREPMDPRLRRCLNQEFAPEVARLGTLLKRDLSHWSKD